MPKRYETICSLPARLYTKGAPVLIETGRLYNDTERNCLVGRVRLENVTETVITEAKVRFTVPDPDGKPVVHSFRELNCGPGELCAWDEPVDLGNAEGDSFTAEVVEVSFRDGPSWKSDPAADWRPLPGSEQPVFAVYAGGAAEKANARPKKQQSEPGQEPEARQEKKEKRSGAVLAAVLIAVALLVAAALLYVFVLRNMLAYSKAGDLFNGARYTEAKAAYTELGGYKDSTDMAKECDYRSAKTLFSAGALEEAEDMFRTLGNYKDCAAWAENCLGAIRIRDYEAAVALLESGRYDQARDAFTALEGYKSSADMALECDYRKAKELMANGDTEAAFTLFEALGEYKESASLAAECAGDPDADRYASASALLEADEYDRAREAFLALGGYKDSADMARECDLRKAYALYTDGDCTGAYEILTGLGGHPGVNELLALVTEELAREAEDGREEYDPEEPDEEPEAEEPAEEEPSYSEADWRVGRYVSFGKYPQTAAGTDRTPIQWQILERSGNKAMLISRFALDAQPYWNKIRAITWEDSALRNWLNDEFIYKAFTSQEYAAIRITENSNGKEQQASNISGGNDTSDRVFLLSYAELQKYFPEKEAKLCRPTEYAESQGVYVHGRSGDTWWWLRSPGNSLSTVSAVNFEGGRTSYAPDRKNGGVRPVIWVDINKLP